MEEVKSGWRIEEVPLSEIVRWPRNPRLHAEKDLDSSMERFGFVAPGLRDEGTGRLVFGHGRVDSLVRRKAAGHPPPERISVNAQGEWLFPIIRGVKFKSAVEAEAYLLADNRIAENGGWTADLGVFLARVRDESQRALEGVGWNAAEAAEAIREAALGGSGKQGEQGGTNEKDTAKAGALSERFVIPPFSVLDARQGYWKDRKEKWLALGLRSEKGRGENLLKFSDTMLGKPGKVAGNAFGTRNSLLEKGKPRRQTSTSIFDPVLCELVYRWFSPKDGAVLDPFAGGSVRGIVASWLGRKYVGIDLRAEQIEANREQWNEIAQTFFLPSSLSPGRAKEEEASRILISDPLELTPVQEVAPTIWFKRDDLFELGGARGSKARALLALLKNAKGVTAAGNRFSPMVARVARAARALGIPARCHCAPSKNYSEQELDAIAHGAELVKHNVGYLKALLSKAEADAKERGWVFVKLGVEAQEYVDALKPQIGNLPAGVKRIVVAVGTGMALAAILQALDACGRKDVRILGVVVGRKPEKLLDRWAPSGWRERVELRAARSPFETPADRTTFYGVGLDPHYEAKAAEHLEPGDLLWCVAVRSTPIEESKNGKVSAAAQPVEKSPPKWIEGDAAAMPLLLEPGAEFDLVFSCPPYADLEVYSEDPRDLSKMPWQAFLAAYRAIIAASVARLRVNRFAAWVIGEVRGPDGFYRKLVTETIEAFEAAGARFYNEAILVTAAGTLPLRTSRVFPSGRKMGKTHQQVLIFVKGSWRRAAEECGPVDIATSIPGEEGIEASLVADERADQESADDGED